MIRNPEIVGSFICYFWVMTILSGQKLKNEKYRFWLQKEVKNWIRYNLLNLHPKLYVVSLLLLSQNHFLRMDEQYGSHSFFNHISTYFFGDVTSFCLTLYEEKVINEKLQFWVTKRDQTFVWAIFLNSRSKNKGGLILQFCLKYQSHLSIRCNNFDAVFKRKRLVRSHPVNIQFCYVSKNILLRYI